MMIPVIAVRIPAMASTSQMETWIPGTSGPTPTPPRWNVIVEKCCDANQAAV